MQTSKHHFISKYMAKKLVTSKKAVGSGEETSKDLTNEIQFVDLSDRELNILYREFYGKGSNRFAFYAGAGWKPEWGNAPMFGIVVADDEFLAERLAYDRGLINPFNCTFRYRIKNLGPAKARVSEAV